MDAKNKTTVERTSDREIVITRTFNGPARIVFDAWTKPELLRRWWVPKSTGITLLSLEADVRTGGTYRLVFAASPEPMAFFGKYLEVTPHSRLVWTNEESGDNASITTVTFEEQGDKTRVVVHHHFPTKQACDEASTGEVAGCLEQLQQLEEMLCA